MVGISQVLGNFRREPVTSRLDQPTWQHVAILLTTTIRSSLSNTMSAVSASTLTEHVVRNDRLLALAPTIFTRLLDKGEKWSDEDNEVYKWWETIYGFLVRVNVFLSRIQSNISLVFRSNAYARHLAPSLLMKTKICWPHFHVRSSTTLNICNVDPC